MEPVKFGKGVFKIGKYPDKRLVWDDIKAFLAVLRTGTLSGAAEQMGVGLATLSRRIERLEDALGLPLFVRQHSGYQLTVDGANLLQQAEAMEAAALSLRCGAREQMEIVGTVRLATAENLATGLILPEIGKMLGAYPDLTIEIVTDIATVNLHRRDADLALRMVKPERGNVTLQRLGTLGYGLYGSRDYVIQRRTVSDLSSYDTDAFVGWCETQSHLPAAQWIERILQGRAPVIATTSLATQISAAKAGLGLAVLPHFLARDAELTCVQGDLGIDQAIYLVIQSDLAQTPRIRIVADFLRNLVESHRHRLSGR
ncbi:LysR family transcriptional regulator [Beijerinckia indica]|uniref:Transcriptional regulator, LysR family n=1 Tax=Beijerinckia indica subsp. indica (strain ATCC 9039 / DSM 1715 / NCIMB 8712) TaxID=395963 RepID=B2IJ78_BEII9|nr:LysR family transcriptional regulator [Beijerinckia indica]ACB94841.1 transcriptional regulator, LysR family [Beijerinckia indica subsp. indica ATCC 9039]